MKSKKSLLISKKVLFALSIFALTVGTIPAHASSHAKTLKNLNATDIIFAQNMILHHQQASDMSKLALKNATSPSIKTMARKIIAAQGKEIGQMKYWLTATKSSMDMDHDMGGTNDMGMDGMLTGKEMKNLSSLKGNKFDKAFLESMIVHHQGALGMVSMLSGTKNAEAKALAKAITLAQSPEIASMRKMLKKLG